MSGLRILVSGRTSTRTIAAGGTGVNAAGSAGDRAVMSLLLTVSSSGGGQVAAEEADLGGIGDDVDGLDLLSAHAQHQQSGEGAAVEAEEGGLPAGRVRDQGGAWSPEPQQVRGDIFRPGDDGTRLGGDQPE